VTPKEQRPTAPEPGLSKQKVVAEAIKIADREGVEFVYRLCAWMPLMGVLTIFLPRAAAMVAVPQAEARATLTTGDQPDI